MSVSSAVATVDGVLPLMLDNAPERINSSDWSNNGLTVESTVADMLDVCIVVVVLSSTVFLRMER